MAVQEKCKRRIFLVCADEAAAFPGNSSGIITENHGRGSYGEVIGNDDRGDYGEVKTVVEGELLSEVKLSDEIRMPEGAGLSAVISASEKRCREYAEHVSGGNVPVFIVNGICELTDEEKRSSYTPRRVISAYREILSSYDGDVAVVASAGYIKALICFLECRDPGQLDEIDALMGCMYEVVIPGRLCAVISADDERGNELYRPMPSDEAPTLMEYELDTLTRAGVAETVIICGKNKEKLEKEFAGHGRIFVDGESFCGQNERYLDSEWDGVFLLPSSVPVFTLFSVQQLMRSMGFDVTYGSSVKMYSDIIECANSAVCRKKNSLSVISPAVNSLTETDNADEKVLLGDSATVGLAAAKREAVMSEARCIIGDSHAGAVPVYKGKRGYPVLIRYEYLKKLRENIQNNKEKKDAQDSADGRINREGVCADGKMNVAECKATVTEGFRTYGSEAKSRDMDASGFRLGEIIASIAKSDDVVEVPVPDPAVVLSTGTRSGCEKAKDHLFSLRTPGLAYCRELLQWMNLPKYKLRHSEKVAFYAREMAEEFNSRGRDTYSLLLDENITAAGGMLHDIAKGYPRHAAVGAAMLRSLNMPRVAEIVENHQNLAERYFHSTSPVLIVYLADKMFCGDECVGIEERFRRKRDKHKGDEKAMKKLAYKEKQALRAKEVYENSILGWPVG